MAIAGGITTDSARSRVMPINAQLKELPLSLAVSLGFSFRWHNRQLEIKPKKTAWLTIDRMENLINFINAN